MRVWKRAVGGGAVAAAAVALGIGAGSLALAQVEDVPPGKLVYDQFCASCHDNPPAGSRTANVAALRRMSSDAIMQTLTAGSMKAIGDQLSPRQRRDVAAWLAPAAPVGTAWIDDNRCPADKRGVDLSAKPAQAGFGVDTDNARRMTAAQAGLKTADLAKLEVAWAFAMPRTTGLRGQGVVVGDTLFYPAGQVNHLLALDTKTGCVKWAVQTKGGIRNSLAYGRLGKDGPFALVGADGGLLAAFDARDGKEIWRVDPRHDRGSPISGSPLFAGDKIIVPISATDVATAMRPSHECCKTHGALAAVDAATGKRLWIWHTMEDAKPLGRKSSAGAELFGPSGAPIWSSPAADLRRGVAYASTGENTSPPGTKT